MVLSYVNSLLDGSYSQAMGPESYWINTAETSVGLSNGFLWENTGDREGLEQLLAGGTVDCLVNENLPYSRIHENGENFWSSLLETGYLTKAVTEQMPRLPLRIPNRSVQEVFRREVWDSFRDRIDNVFVEELDSALWTEEVERAENTLNRILESVLSFYHEYHEYSYHLILAGLFTGLGYRVQSERETGYGRSDLIILDPAKARSMVLELKHVKDRNEMQSALKVAHGQIIREKYESVLICEGYTTRLRYAVSFSSKQVMIRKA